MRQIRYKDGTPSREVEEEEDFESTGQEEMNNVYDKYKEKTSVLDVRDELNNVTDLVETCAVALLSEKTGWEDRSRKKIAHVLFFYVANKLTELEEALAKL